MSDSNIAQALDTYSSLKSVKGHFNGGTHNPDVDGFDGKKHQVLKDIQAHFGKPGQNAGEIIEKLGQPDRKEISVPELARQEAIEGGGQVKQDIDSARIPGGGMAPMMPGPGIYSSENPNASVDNFSPEYFYMIYQWRGNHDYVYFKVDANSDKVVNSGWYHALE